MTKQVDQWKEKAVKRGDESRYLRKENARIKKERDVYKRKAKLAEKRVKELQAVVKVPTLNAKADIVFIALQLFILARIGFRAISRVLGVLGQVLGIRKVPTPQTIINWVNRLAITRIQQAEHLLECRRRPCGSNGYIWIIDSSIALGAGKILCVLALRADHYRNGKRAPCLQNVHCIAVAVSASWTGVSVAAFLLKVIEVMGYPDAFLKDRGTDLAKAVRLLGEQGYNTSSIDDVSHVIANLLKHEYGNHPMFETFISACGKVSQKLKQTVLACLVVRRRPHSNL